MQRSIAHTADEPDAALSRATAGGMEGRWQGVPALLHCRKAARLWRCQAFGSRWLLLLLLRPRSWGCDPVLMCCKDPFTCGCRPHLAAPLPRGMDLLLCCLCGTQRSWARSGSCAPGGRSQRSGSCSCRRAQGAGGLQLLGRPAGGQAGRRAGGPPPTLSLSISAAVSCLPCAAGFLWRDDDQLLLGLCRCPLRASPACLRADAGAVASGSGGREGPTAAVAPTC
jgi:hypothetical protein